jgi:hypothetical protein
MHEHPIEDDLASLQRRRLLAQLDLPFADLSDEQSAAIDQICQLLPMADEPALLQHAVLRDRPSVCRMLRALPRTAPIERMLNGHWPT